MQRAGSNSKTGNTVKRMGITRDKGTTHNTPPPPFNRTTEQTEGGHRTQDGESQRHYRPSLTMPPTIRYATPPSTTTPPTIHDEGGEAHRGDPTTRTTQTHTNHPHTTRLARNNARHDSSTRQHCNGMSRARVAPLHWARQQQHTPPPFHTPRRMDTTHSSTLTHSCSHNR